MRIAAIRARRVSRTGSRCHHGRLGCWSPLASVADMMTYFAGSTRAHELGGGELWGRGDGLEEVVDDAVGGDSLGLGVEGGHDAVAEDRLGDVTDVGDA